MQPKSAVIDEVSLLKEAFSSLPRRIRAQCNAVELITFRGFEPRLTQEYEADCFVSFFVRYDKYGNRWACTFVHTPSI